MSTTSENLLYPFSNYENQSLQHLSCNHVNHVTQGVQKLVESRDCLPCATAIAKNKDNDDRTLEKLLGPRVAYTSTNF